MKKIIIVLMSILVILTVILFLLFKNQNKHVTPKKSDFINKIINVVNKKEKDNYLISPYSIEMALQMLSEGTDTTTFKEIDALIGKRQIPMLMAKDHISVANALFLKEKYKDIVNKEFVNKLKSNYDAEVLIDKFENPDKINAWVNEKTYEMIPKVVDQIDELFVLGLANAIAIDVEWVNKFECNNTSSEMFKNDKEKIETEMMHAEYHSNIKYIDDKDIQGVIIPYMSYDKDGKANYNNEGTTLEFVGILPKDINAFIANFNNRDFNKLTSSFKDLQTSEELNLSLPRFKYDYKLDLIDVLKELGVNEIFSKNADFTKIFGEKGDLYISDAIHKTHIELSENGTKAAAVTYFGIKANSLIEDNKIINITFNKPFVYIIRDTKTKEILFIGIVKSPNKWNGSTCEKK